MSKHWSDKYWGRFEQTCMGNIICDHPYANANHVGRQGRHWGLRLGELRELADEIRRDLAGGPCGERVTILGEPSSCLGKLGHTGPHWGTPGQLFPD